MTYSIKTYPSDGVTTDFDITFDYLDASHVVVSVENILTSSIGSDYTFSFNNATNVRVSTVAGNLPVPAGREIKIERRTPIQTPAVVFGAGSSLSSENLNKNALYLTYALQEATDENDAFTKLYLGAFDTPPVTNNDGGPLQVGAVYFDTSEVALYYWTGTMWLIGASTFPADVAAQVEIKSEFPSRASFISATISPANDIIRFSEGGRQHRLIRSVGGPITQTNGQTWKPLGDATPEMFSATWATDVGEGLRAARDWVEAQGGGTISLGENTYILNTVETEDIYKIKSDEDGIYAVSAGIFLPAGVSLHGPENRRATIQKTGGTTSMDAIIGLKEYGNASIRDLTLIGVDSTGNAYHGFLTMNTTAGEYTVDRMSVERVSVRDVGSYGFGHQYGGITRSILRDIDIRNTGSDGLDWKVRGPLGQETPSDTVTFENIRIETFGVRVVGGSSTGFGLRGHARIHGLWIYDIGDSQVGLQLVPGISDPTRGDIRRSAFYTEVSGVYAEGRSPRSTNPAIGVESYAVDRCVISNVVAKHCILKSNLAAVSPASPLHGPVWRNCVVIPPHGKEWGAVIDVERTSMDIEVQSDYDLFDVRAGTATVGQTVFTLPLGNPTPNYSVVRGGVTITTGFVVVGDTLTLGTGLGATEALHVVYPALRAVRVNAGYCQVRGGCDEWLPAGVSYGTTANFQTGSHLGFFWRGNGNLTEINSTTITGIQAGGTATDVDLRLTGTGNGKTTIVRPQLLLVPTDPTGIGSGSIWNDSGTLKIAP